MNFETSTEKNDTGIKTIIAIDWRRSSNAAPDRYLKNQENALRTVGQT